MVSSLSFRSFGNILVIDCLILVLALQEVSLEFIGLLLALKVGIIFDWLKMITHAVFIKQTGLVTNWRTKRKLSAEQSESLF